MRPIKGIKQTAALSHSDSVLHKKRKVCTSVLCLLQLRLCSFTLPEDRSDLGVCALCCRSLSGAAIIFSKERNMTSHKELRQA